MHILFPRLTAVSRWAALILIVGLLSVGVVTAQDDDTTPTITFTGTVTEVDGDTIVVNSLTVDISNVTVGNMILTVNVGDFVEVSGALQADGSVVAVSVVIIVSNDDRDDNIEGTAIALDKFVAVGEPDNWSDADDAPGLLVEVDDDDDDDNDRDVFFRFVVTNNGTETLTDFRLTDSVYDTAACVIPDELAAGDTFECIIGPFDLEDEHRNTASVSAEDAAGTVVSDTDDAIYTVTNEDDDDQDDNGDNDDDDLEITIVIEGPVEEINVNVIIIYGIEIEIDPDDPILTVIRIGDIIRIEGDVDDLDGTITIIVINITIIDVDIFINDDGDAWRDGECNNPPPPWAPANGWRSKCEGGGNGSGGNGGGNGGGGDRDDDD